ncbi:unnamed protein product, partial [Staurois parvus]
MAARGLTSGEIRGLTVCCVMQCHAKQCAGADRGEICIVYIQISPPSVILGNRQVPAVI